MCYVLGFHKNVRPEEVGGLWLSDNHYPILENVEFVYYIKLGILETCVWAL